MTSRDANATGAATAAESTTLTDPAGNGKSALPAPEAAVRRRGSSLGHLRGLDGIRALSVLAIMAYHGLSWVPGGYYGVDAFFVLSGFLITSLLLKEWETTGTVRLRSFWARRARRLLPALFVLVAVLGIVMAAMPALLNVSDPLGDSLSALFYASNWFSVHSGVNYFSASSAQQSPLLHTWSLAIEEQFYLVWPLVVLGVLTVSLRRGRVRSGRRSRLVALFFVAGAGSLASALLMARLAPGGFTARTYYGTDTRAQALLVGAAIAIGLLLWRKEPRDSWFSRLCTPLGIAGLVGLVAMWVTTHETSTFAFRGGFLVASLAAGALVLGCVVVPTSPVVRLLELPPLPYLGRISYGIYLWYWPVVLVMTPGRLHWSALELFVARVAITVAIASVSYHLVEMPIRHGVLRGWRGWIVAPVGASCTIAVVVVASLVPLPALELQGTQLTPSTTGVAASSGVRVPAGGRTDLAPYLVPPTRLGPLPAPRAGSRTGVSGRPVKVLLVGDSMAGSLGAGLAPEAGRFGVQIVNEGIGGCSLSMQNMIHTLFYALPPGLPCDAGGNPDALFTTWRRWVDAYNPDVVVYVARGETYNQEIDGIWQNLGQPSMDRYLAGRFRSAIDVLGSRGADVVLLTTPYYAAGVPTDPSAWPAGDTFPEDAPNRVVVDNEIMREVVGSTTDQAGRRTFVFDLNALVSPGKRYSNTVGPYNVRCGDGVHFTRSGGILVGTFLAPELAVLGRGHAAASPGGAWRGHPPPTTPVWYAKVPCG